MNIERNVWHNKIQRKLNNYAENDSPRMNSKRKGTRKTEKNTGLMKISGTGSKPSHMNTTGCALKMVFLCTRPNLTTTLCSSGWTFTQTLDFCTQECPLKSM
ncbi:uncharacterized protein LOC118435131 isoform X2 [Folsomia candida]|uniref:uncharacterized protein LOC118435131 isoform X2 n=1 Tax=Folsomia candida TaxID=158441 RepID=UPI0016050A43|nr:uncharacterized protein LOC118435131 isoform X2 [Folsomia candida]